VSEKETKRTHQNPLHKTVQLKISTKSVPHATQVSAKDEFGAREYITFCIIHILAITHWTHWSDFCFYHFWNPPSKELHFVFPLLIICLKTLLKAAVTFAATMGPSFESEMLSYAHALYWTCLLSKASSFVNPKQIRISIKQRPAGSVLFWQLQWGIPASFCMSILEKRSNAAWEAAPPPLLNLSDVTPSNELLSTDLASDSYFQPCIPCTEPQVWKWTLHVTISPSLSSHLSPSPASQ